MAIDNCNLGLRMWFDAYAESRGDAEFCKGLAGNLKCGAAWASHELRCRQEGDGYLTGGTPDDGGGNVTVNIDDAPPNQIKTTYIIGGVAIILVIIGIVVISKSK